MKLKLTNDAVLSSSTARQFWFAGEQQFLKLNVNKNRLEKEHSGGGGGGGDEDPQSCSFPQIICYVILYVTYTNSWVYHLKLKITACEII